MLETEESQRVLIVEDSQMDRMLIKRQLLNANGRFDVDEVSSFRGAIAKLDSGEKYDLVLLDLDLPDTSGRISPMQMIAEVEKYGCSVTILSGNQDPQAAKQIKKHGVPFLGKDQFLLSRQGELAQALVKYLENSSRGDHPSTHSQIARLQVQQEECEKDMQRLFSLVEGNNSLTHRMIRLEQMIESIKEDVAEIGELNKKIGSIEEAISKITSQSLVKVEDIKGRWAAIAAIAVAVIGFLIQFLK